MKAGEEVLGIELGHFYRGVRWTKSVVAENKMVRIIVLSLTSQTDAV